MATTITQSQALDLEQRLLALERRVGVDKQKPDDASTLDDRLSKLKAQLNEKLSKVESTKHHNTTTTTTANNNKDNYKIIQKLLKELDPGIALTHQQQPLLYKRQQVLACSDELKQDFGQLERLLRLLLKGTKEEKPEGVGADAAKAASAATTKTPTKSSSSSSKTPQKKDLAQQAKETAQQKLSQQQQQQADPSRNTTATQLRLDQVTQAPLLTQHYAKSEQDRKRVEDLAHKFQSLHERTTALQQTLRHYLECYHTTAMAVSEKIVLADETIGAKLAAAAK